jgi:hypothetical protein
MEGLLADAMVLIAQELFLLEAQNPKPYRWAESAREILASVRGFS